MNTVAAFLLGVLLGLLTGILGWGAFAQCPAEYYVVDGAAMICTPGTKPTNGVYIGEGKSDCNLVKDCG